MDSATWWWILAGAVLVAELLTGGFFLLMFSLGLAAGALAAHAGLDLAGQLLSAGVVGGLGVALWGVWKKRQPHLDSQSDPSVLMDVGQTVDVTEWHPDGSAQVRHRGVTWSAELATGAARAPGPHRIVAVQGSRLVLAPL